MKQIMFIWLKDDMFFAFKATFFFFFFFGNFKDFRFSFFIQLVLFLIKTFVFSKVRSDNLLNELFEIVKEDVVIGGCTLFAD